MIILCIGDTHDCNSNEFDIIAELARKRKADLIIHTGDILDEHIGHTALNDFKVVLSMTNQNPNYDRSQAPKNWILVEEKKPFFEIETLKGNKIPVIINHYLGMKHFLSTLGDNMDDISKKMLGKIIEKFQNDYGYVAYVFCGHSHRQNTFNFLSTMVINPGAWKDNDHVRRSFAVVDTFTWDVTMGSLTKHYPGCK
jgi:predicted phosphodiesterase